MKLRHPDARKPIEVPEDRVEMYRSQGWTAVAAKPAKKAAAKKAAPEPVEPAEDSEGVDPDSE